MSREQDILFQAASDMVREAQVKASAEPRYVIAPPAIVNTDLRGVQEILSAFTVSMVDHNNKASAMFSTADASTASLRDMVQALLATVTTQNEQIRDLLREIKNLETAKPVKEKVEKKTLEITHSDGTTSTIKEQ
jgi:hypothetical protein